VPAPVDPLETPRTNWAGTHTYRATRTHTPSTLEQLQELAATRPRLRVLGSRHSFTGIADSAELVSLERLPRELSIDRDAMAVSVDGAMRYGELAPALAGAGLALANLASLPHIAVAGAVATATHGSGDRNGNLATAVSGLQLVTSDGAILRLARGDADFDGAVVGLGALGAVTRITLDVEPTYEVRQQVFEHLRWEALFAHFDEITAGGYSVSAFTVWGGAVDQVWVKNRVGSPLDPAPGELFGAARAHEDRHPIAGLDPVNCTPQRGSPGPWHERLPHFRLGFTPSSGAEIQSEYIVARDDGIDALRALRRISATIRPLIQVGEIRTVAADGLWMSPQYGRDSVAIHFTWKREPAAVRRALAEIERALAPFRARPHWGKLFLADAAAIGPLYECRGDFAALVSRLDPRGAFRNDWLERHVLGTE
jgi:xylitol oxidase